MKVNLAVCKFTLLKFCRGELWRRAQLDKPTNSEKDFLNKLPETHYRHVNGFLYSS